VYIQSETNSIQYTIYYTCIYIHIHAHVHGIVYTVTYIYLTKILLLRIKWLALTSCGKLCMGKHMSRINSQCKNWVTLGSLCWPTHRSWWWQFCITTQTYDTITHNLNTHAPTCLSDEKCACSDARISWIHTLSWCDVRLWIRACNIASCHIHSLKINAYKI